jgi:hypothetical protein
MQIEPTTRLNRRTPVCSFAPAILVALLVGWVSPAYAQKNSNFATVNLQANMVDSLSVTAAPALVNFNLVAAGGVAPGSVPVAITTSWNLHPPLTATTYAYFSSAAIALTDGVGDNIASSRVLGSVNGGAFTALTGVSPFSANASLQIFSVRIKGFNRVGSNTDNLNLEIDTTGLLLPAGTYSGLLIIQAQAI